MLLLACSGSRKPVRYLPTLIPDHKVAGVSLGIASNKQDLAEALRSEEVKVFLEV